MAAGGKFDFTAKWWEPARYQTVVDRFRGKILFVQVGEKGHHHPPLRGVLDLRGKTALRQLVRLVHHAHGVLCPVTLPMHLAAAVPVGREMPRNRPCVVVAGGREPAQWEAYPNHQYLHTNGALRCCDQGGCWKSRVIPLGDGDKKDSSLCVDVVELVTGECRPGKEWGEMGMNDGAARKADAEWVMRFLPRCLEMITAEDVIRRIQLYLDGGASRPLDERERQACRARIPGL